MPPEKGKKRSNDVTMAATPQRPLPPPQPPVLDPEIGKKLNELAEQCNKLKAEIEACKIKAEEGLREDKIARSNFIHDMYEKVEKVEQLARLRRPPTYIDSSTLPLPSPSLPLPTDTPKQRGDAICILMEALEDTLLASNKAGDNFVNYPCLERFSDLDTELHITGLKRGTTTTGKNWNTRGFYDPANGSKEEKLPTPPLLLARTYVDSSTSPQPPPPPLPPPLPPKGYAEAAVQALLPLPLPVRTYAEAATQA